MLLKKVIFFSFYSSGKIIFTQLNYKNIKCSKKLLSSLISFLFSIFLISLFSHSIA